MSDEIVRIDAGQLKARLHDGGEIALLDAREEAVFGRRHLLMASVLSASLASPIRKTGARALSQSGIGLRSREKLNLNSEAELYLAPKCLR